MDVTAKGSGWREATATNEERCERQSREWKRELLPPRSFGVFDKKEQQAQKRSE